MRKISDFTSKTSAKHFVGTTFFSISEINYFTHKYSNCNNKSVILWLLIQKFIQWCMMLMLLIRNNDLYSFLFSGSHNFLLWTTVFKIHCIPSSSFWGAKGFTRCTWSVVVVSQRSTIYYKAGIKDICC